MGRGGQLANNEVEQCWVHERLQTLGAGGWRHFRVDLEQAAIFHDVAVDGAG